MKKIISLFVILSAIFAGIFVGYRNVGAQVSSIPSIRIIDAFVNNAQNGSYACLDEPKCSAKNTNSSDSSSYIVSVEKPYIYKGGMFDDIKSRFDFTHNRIFTTAWAERYLITSSRTVSYFDEKTGKGHATVTQFGPKGQTYDSDIPTLAVDDNLNWNNAMGSDSSSSWTDVFFDERGKPISNSGIKDTYFVSYNSRKYMVVKGDPKKMYKVTISASAREWHLNKQADADERFGLKGGAFNPRYIISGTKEISCSSISIMGNRLNRDCKTEILVSGEGTYDVTPSTGLPRYAYSQPDVLGISNVDTFGKSTYSNNFASVYQSISSVEPVTLNGWGFATIATSTNILKFTDDVGRTFSQSVIGSGNQFRIDFTPNVLPGNYWVDLTNSITGSTSNKVQLSVVSSHIVPKTISIVTRIGGRTLSATEAGSCVANISRSTISDTGSCVRTINNQTPGSYFVVWYGGYPTGADTSKSPTVTPAQVLVNDGLTFYLDFIPKVVVPLTPTISIITRLNGRALTTAEAGSCYTNFYSPYFSSTNIGSCTRTLTDADTMRTANMHLNIGDTYKIDWKGGYPTGADTSKNPTVTPAQVLTASGATFYLDFQAATTVPPPIVLPPASTTSITVLPMSQTMPVQPGSMLNYGLNWAGGPLNQPDADAWKIFVHLERQGGGATIAGDFFPTLLLSKWTSNARGFSTFSSILIPEDTQLGIYNVYVGIYRGPNRQALIPGSGVIAENGGTSKRYLVGTVQIGDQVTKNVNQNNTAAIQQTGANSLWNVVKRWFGF